MGERHLGQCQPWLAAPWEMGTQCTCGQWGALRDAAGYGGAPALLPCLAPLSPKLPVRRAKVEPSVLLLQVEGKMPRMDGLAGAMPGMSWGEGNKE